jgi:hypothetical protein
MSSLITNDKNATINCNTNKIIDIISPPTKIDDFIVVDDNKSQLINSIQTALDTAKLSCSFAFDINKKTSDVLSKTKLIKKLGKQMKINVKKNKNCITTTLATLKVAQKIKNNNVSPNSLDIAENILLLSKNVLEIANNFVKQITDMVTVVVDAKKASIDVGKAILTIKTAILTAQQIADTDTSFAQTIKDEINNALQSTNIALSDAIDVDINISSIKSHSEFTKLAAVNALTYSKKTKNSAKANITITKATLNNPNKITDNIPVKPIKSIKDIQLKAQNTFIETNKIIEHFNCIISKRQTVKPTITTSVKSIQKIIEVLELILSLL